MGVQILLPVAQQGDSFCLQIFHDLFPIVPERLCKLPLFRIRTGFGNTGKGGKGQGAEQGGTPIRILLCACLLQQGQLLLLGDQKCRQFFLIYLCGQADRFIQPLDACSNGLPQIVQVHVDKGVVPVLFCQLLHPL